MMPTFHWSLNMCRFKLRTEEGKICTYLKEYRRMHGVSYERIPESSGHGPLSSGQLTAKDVEMSSYSPRGNIEGDEGDEANANSTTKKTLQTTAKLAMTVALGISALLLIFSMLSLAYCTKLAWRSSRMVQTSL